MTPSEYQNIPYISNIIVGNDEYAGVIINRDNQLTSFYDVKMIKDRDLSDEFLSFCECWWWESNRRIPINIFLWEQLKPYRFFIKSLNSRDTVITFGHVVSLTEIAEKRPKRKTIQLMRRPE